MARRKRKTFSGTTADHKRIRAMNVRGFRSFMRAYRQAMKRRECRAAHRALKSAAMYAGAASAERLWSGKRLSILGGAQRAVRFASRGFEARCLRIGYDKG